LHAAASVSDRLRKIDDIVALIQAEEAKADRKLGTYKERES
jgi:hypothetical protein